MTTQGRADTLAETLLTMDVVDQLRHRDDHLRQLAAKGLDDADLKRRLTETYRSQVIEVTDAILDAGIAAQRERRPVYRAPEGFAARLAGIWIDRGAVGKKAARALGTRTGSSSYSSGSSHSSSNDWSSDSGSFSTGGGFGGGGSFSTGGGF